MTRKGIGHIAASAFLALLASFLLAALPVRAQDSGYRIRAGDLLRVEVLEDNSLNRNLLVAPDGRIAMPLAGSLVAGGRTLEAIQGDLTNRLAPSFATAPTVFVGIDRIAERAAGGGNGATGRMVEVFVMGEAAKPGRMEVRPGTTLLQALAQMGGFTKFAARKRVQLHRGGQIHAFDYDAIEAGRSPSGGTVLVKGDVIVIPQRRLFE